MTTQVPDRQAALEALEASPFETRDEAIWAAIGFKPTPKSKLILASDARTVQVVGGEQSGKTVSACMWATDQFWTDSSKPQLVWIVGKHYEMTRFAYGYLSQYIKASGLSTNISSAWNPGLITAHGNLTIRTKSALDAESLMGEAPHIILVEEAAQLPWDSLLRVFARAGPNRARTMISGTYEGSIGWYPETYDQWTQPAIMERDGVAAFSIPSWENLHKYPGGREDPEILRLERLMPPDQFNERIAAKAAPPKGLVHGLFRLRIHAAKPLEWLKGEHLYIGIDPGKAHAGSAYAVVVAQKPKDQPLRIIDVVYEQGRGTEELIDICQGKWWWGQGPMHGTIDRAGARENTVSNYTDADLWARAGLPCLYEYIPIMEGIARVNSMLKVNPITGVPGMLIDPATCLGLIAEWGGCSSPLGGGTKVYQWESNREGEILGGVPRDRYNDASKALAYMICLNWPKFNQTNESRFMPITRFGQQAQDIRKLAGR